MRIQLLLLAFVLFMATGTISAQDKPPETEAELAKKLVNPISSLISVPFQNNTDVGIGQYNGSRNTLNFQPVIPISLSPKLNLISRLVLPIVTQQDISAPGVKESGLSDATLSTLFSPSSSKNGLSWGIGPIFLIPTATEKLLGTDKFGIGPSAVVLKQVSGWTIGTLVNQIWSVAGNSNRDKVNQLYLQPFLFYNWQSGAGLGSVFEITQNWETNTTAAYFIPSITGLTKLGKQRVQLVIGPRIPISMPANVRPDFGVRAMVGFVFPK